MKLSPGFGSGGIVDPATPIPNIEAFDQLLPYLRSQGILGKDEPVVCNRLTGGVSNKTVRIERLNPPHLVVKQALPQLRVAVDWFSSPLRIHREFAALCLSDQLLPSQVPKAIFQDRTCHVIVMTEIPGPYVNWKDRMLQGHVLGIHWQEFGRMLARFHMATTQDRQTVPQELHDRTFFQTLRLEPYYEYTGTQIGEAQSFLNALVEETLSHRLALVHGDYSPKNVLIADNRLFLLDYEVCHVGDPAFDVGFALTHALSKGHFLAPLRPRFQQAAMQFWQTYRTASGYCDFRSNMELRCIRHTLACLLARAAGRSPLEYLNAKQKAVQIRTVLALLANLPPSVPQLITSFLSHLDNDRVPVKHT